MLWNEPNNLSHWDFTIDPEWKRFADLARLAGAAVRAERPGLTRVLGGTSPIDAKFVALMDAQGALDEVDAIAIHGFPLDWNHWPIHEWPDRLAEIVDKSIGRASTMLRDADALRAAILGADHAA